MSFCLYNKKNITRLELPKQTSLLNLFVVKILHDELWGARIEIRRYHVHILPSSLAEFFSLYLDNPFPCNIIISNNQLFCFLTGHPKYRLIYVPIETRSPLFGYINAAYFFFLSRNAEGSKVDRNKMLNNHRLHPSPHVKVMKMSFCHKVIKRISTLL